MRMVPDLSVKIAGIHFQNPVLAASGTFGYGDEFDTFLNLSDLGGIVVKGTSAKPIAGNPPPRLFPTASGMLNAIGLENVGVDAFLRDKLPLLRRHRTNVIVNVFGFVLEDYVEVVEKLNAAEGISAYELNISCPNTERGGMVFGTDRTLTHQLTAAVKKRSARPVFVKLSPNVTHISDIARAAEEGGADALSVANTFLAMAIDVKTFRPRLANITGGLSGPAIRPIVLRMVYEVCRAVRIPVIALGGIESGEDAVEYLLAGAHAVQVGTANFADPRAPIRILGGLTRFMERRDFASLEQLIGKLET